MVAPAMVLDGGVWRDEIAKWADTPDRFTLAPYTRLNQRELLHKTVEDESGEIKEKVAGNRPIQKIRPEYDRTYQTVILDECHYIKGRKTLWTGAVERICARAERVYLLTGTPIPNWAHELFIPLRVLDPDAARPGQPLGSYWKWVERWFSVGPRYAKNGRKLTDYAIGDLKRCDEECEDRPASDPCEHYRQFAERNLGPAFLRRLRDDVLTDLPPLTQQRIETPMTREQKRVYTVLKQDYYARLEDGTELLAWNSSALNVALDRLTTGIGVMGKGHDPLAHSGKLERLAADLADRAQPTLVVAHYRDSVDAAVAVVVKLGRRVGKIHGGTSQAERGRVVDAFQAGELDVLVGSLETISEGLTLTAADTIIMLETSYKPSRNEQAIRRIHRLGQTRPCTVLDYVTPKTVDENKRDLLATKTDRQMRTLTAADFARLL